MEAIGIPKARRNESTNYACFLTLRYRSGQNEKAVLKEVHTEKKKENDPPINQISCSTFDLNVGLKAYASVTPSFILSYTHLNPSVVTDSARARLSTIAAIYM